eukprot:TRINITY_DN39738_c0_g1_i1.p1 TRINITY_DN39738_c0_g1~~TRINITY_DN39738_c0_g1_i1.p1  ORF type:complete len:550 (-),score=69.41 TRINITY_DN39738_c0_g1_i1:525-2174(-)
MHPTSPKGRSSLGSLDSLELGADKSPERNSPKTRSVWTEFLTEGNRKTQLAFLRVGVRARRCMPWLVIASETRAVLPRFIFWCLLSFVFPVLMGYFLDMLIETAVALSTESAMSELAAQYATDAVAAQNGALLDRAAFPLRTSGRHIVDASGARVRLKCVNWYGAHLSTYVVGGLKDHRLPELAAAIRSLGFNCVRLPYSLELQLDGARPYQEQLGPNEGLWNQSGLQILDATVHAMAAEKLMIILNNHQGRAMWCCDESDGEGLWYTDRYPERVWLQSLRDLAARYKAEKFVIGYDIRNELRGIPEHVPQLGTVLLRPTWGESDEASDWAAAALKGSLAVSDSDPDALIFIEGLQYATDLSGVRRGPKLHDYSSLLRRIVYSAHEYNWTSPDIEYACYVHWFCLGWAAQVCWQAWRLRNRKQWLSQRGIQVRLVACTLGWCASYWLSSYERFAARIASRWGYLLIDGEAPVWLGEFGTNGFWVTADWPREIGEVTWWRHLMRYIREQELDYAYWAFNGDNAGSDETFGIMDITYKQIRQPKVLVDLGL